MKMFVVTLFNYAIAMAIEHELQTHLNSNYKIFASNIRLPLGYPLIHVLIYGLLLLGLWFYLVIRVAVSPCEDLCLLVGRDLQNLKRLAEDAIQRLFGRQEICDEILSIPKILAFWKQLSWEMKISVVALINYAIAMAIEYELQTYPNSNYKTYARNIRLLLGYIAIVLLALIHVLLYGVLLMRLWVYLLTRVARHPYQDLYLLVGKDLQHLKELAEVAIQRLFGGQE